MKYRYDNLVPLACLAYVEDKVHTSAMTDKAYTDISLNPEEGWLDIWFDTNLSVGDKTILDGIVSDSQGIILIKKPRTRIMAEILFTAEPDPAQLSRLLDALDSYPSVAIALDGMNYELARMRVAKVLADGAITEDDYDLVMAIIPASKYQTL